MGGAATCTTAKLPAGLRGPMQPVLVGLDPRPRASVKRTDQELDALVGFVRDGLLDPDARPERLRAVIPTELPSGRAGFVVR